MNNDFIIRLAEESDLQTVFLLLKEFAGFQKTPEKLKLSAEQFQKDKDHFHCLVAVVRNEIVGFTTFFPAYYSWSGKAFYVDDLYVKYGFRGRGIGKQLLTTVFRFAKEDNCTKVRWQVSRWNANAIDFYKSIGANVEDTEYNCDYVLD